jgi:hypothetical protein
MSPDPRVAIVDRAFDVDLTEEPFGKRWRDEKIFITEEHLNALRQGKLLALDTQEEYVVFVELTR